MASRVDVIKPLNAPTALDARAPWKVTGADEISLYSAYVKSTLGGPCLGCIVNDPASVDRNLRVLRMLLVQDRVNAAEYDDFA